MIAISSALENYKDQFVNLNHSLAEFGFSLGGNWDYNQGCFDRFLDEAHKVWLRIPFQVTSGTLDGISDSTDAVVQIGAPFVLKHLYNEGLDQAAAPNVYASLVNQFQEPIDKDAPVEEKWIHQAKQILAEVEQGIRL